MSTLQDFPICFAEFNPQLDESSEFYVEWLDNNEEFPSLSNMNNLNGGSWEVLQRKELNDNESFNVVPAEEDWSTLIQNDGQKPYAKIAEYAACLQPLKRPVKPLWPERSSNIKKNISAAALEDEDKDILFDTSSMYQDNLGEELKSSQKGRSRKAARYSKNRKLHDLRTIDIHIDGILSIATSREGTTTTTWKPNRNVEVSYEAGILTAVDFFTKAQALAFSSRFSHNFKRFSFKYVTGKMDQKRGFYDNTESSIYEPIIKKA